VRFSVLSAPTTKALGSKYTIVCDVYDRAVKTTVTVMRKLP
jgi:hypothetical protein